MFAYNTYTQNIITVVVINTVFDLFSNGDVYDTICCTLFLRSSEEMEDCGGEIKMLE